MAQPKQAVIHSIPPFRWYYFFIAIPFFLFSLLPFWVIHFISDVLVLLMRNAIGYRKKVIYTNLKNAFPEKSESEIKKIADAYYRNMIDVFLETIKTMTMSRESVMKRCRFNQIEMANNYLQHHSLIVMLGHMGNWEWGGFSYTYHTAPRQTNTLYHPLSNKFFDWLMYYIRHRCDLFLIPMHQALKSIIHYNKQICTHSFIADQSPSPETALWTTFLNQDTAFFTGSEKIAAKLKAPVIYAGLYRYRRGYYQVDFSLITPDASKEEQGFVTKRFAELLAIDIQHHPEQWLWSHRRWKHKRLN